MFKKIINWWRYKKAIKEEYSKINFNCKNCTYFDINTCKLLGKEIKNSSNFVCDNFEISRYRKYDAQRIAYEKISNFREVKK